MRIISESSEQLLKIKKKKDLIPTIVDNIFSICKEDKNFSISNDIDDIDNKILELKDRIKKQNLLLNQAKQMEETLSTKIKVLDDDSYSIKVRVLESLGSEL